MRWVVVVVFGAAVAGCGGSDEAADVSRDSCRHQAAIELYGSYEKCAEFARSIGSDPDTGQPLD